MAKSAQQKIAARIRFIADELSKKGKLLFTEVERGYEEQFESKSKSTIKRDLRPIEFLIDKTETALRFSSFITESLWAGTAVGDRLRDKKEEKQKLAKKTVNILIRTDKIDRVIFGGGTTVYEVAKAIFDIPPYLGIKRIHTCNLLVLCEFIRRKIKEGDSLGIDIAKGELQIEAGMLYSTDGINYLAGLEVDAVITSFYGLCRADFYTNQHYEVEEKLANIFPHSECKNIIIPIEWGKIGHHNVDIMGNDRKKRKKFADEIKAGRNYVIVTNPPGGKSKVDLDKHEILECWKDKGVKLEYA